MDRGDCIVHVGNTAALRLELDALYERFNRPEYVDPDPLMFVRRFWDVADREIVALVANSEDPAKYDFGLTRAAMRGLDPLQLFF